MNAPAPRRAADLAREDDAPGARLVYVAVNPGFAHAVAARLPALFPRAASVAVVAPDGAPLFGFARAPSP